jgi:hypothetical protein
MRTDFDLCCFERDSETNFGPSLASRSHDQIIKDELILFREILRREIPNINNSTCPLAFFKEYQKQLPNLAEIAKIVFCSTATSCESEFLFSDAGELISEKRTCLAPELVEELLMLKRNA